MPYKDAVKQKESQSKHYLKNKNKYKQSTIERRTYNKIYVDILKKQKGCQSPNCELTLSKYDPDVLQYHHVDPSTKKIDISDAVKYWGIEKILKEIDKCVVWCAVCHTKHEALTRRNEV